MFFPQNRTPKPKGPLRKAAQSYHCEKLVG